uniref:Chitin-binding type-2 domain-containing protein n=1 Tax=Megaselia scalaris TaxID=36166 RepID=T1GL49_MEGSC
MKEIIGALLIIGLLGCCSAASCPDPCNESNQFSKQPCQGDCTKFWIQFFDCCEDQNGEIWYFDPKKEECSLDESVCIPEVPIVCPDPCNESNQFSKQPCEGDCTKFWMCNAYIPGVDPVECADPCNESNQFTNQPCDDCTKFWMCNAYVPGNVTSLLIDCCEDKNGVKWYYDRKKGECSLDENVCPK